jgi:pyridoxal phosphate enzyme (YggS family)
MFNISLRIGSMNTTIAENFKRLRASIPPQVELVAAAKTRSPEEVRQVIGAGARVIGENYVQEAEGMRAGLGEMAREVRWHMIGHLQRNKVKSAVGLFDMIETVDSGRLAREIDKRCRPRGKIMPVLVEINSGREPQKTGVMPEEAVELVREISALDHIRVMGLMTMGPPFGDPEDARPFFRVTRELFERIRSMSLDRVDCRHLSMGMTNSYRIAIEEGTTMVRIGTALFGPREKENR